MSVSRDRNLLNLRVAMIIVLTLIALWIVHYCILNDDVWPRL